MHCVTMTGEMVGSMPSRSGRPDGLNLNVSYLAPANGQSLIARARAIQVGRTIGVAHVDVASLADGVETPCAVAIVTLRRVDLPAE